MPQPQRAPKRSALQQPEPFKQDARLTSTTSAEDGEVRGGRSEAIRSAALLPNLLPKSSWSARRAAVAAPPAKKSPLLEVTSASISVSGEEQVVRSVGGDSEPLLAATLGVGEHEAVCAGADPVDDRYAAALLCRRGQMNNSLLQVQAHRSLPARLSIERCDSVAELMVMPTVGRSRSENDSGSRGAAEDLTVVCTAVASKDISAAHRASMTSGCAMKTATALDPALVSLPLLDALSHGAQHGSQDEVSLLADPFITQPSRRGRGDGHGPKQQGGLSADRILDALETVVNIDSSSTLRCKPNAFSQADDVQSHHSLV